MPGWQRRCRPVVVRFTGCRRRDYGLAAVVSLERTLSLAPFIRWTDRVRFWIVLALVLACFLWGGGSRLDIPGLILLQPLAIMLAAALLLIPGPLRWETVRAPLLVLAALAVVIAVQLVPLPPELWLALPGHGQFAPYLGLAGDQHAWRPLSLTPDLTLASLVGLSVPAAALIGFASLSEVDGQRLVLVLLVGVALSIILGLGQILGGPDSSFYRYTVTNEGQAVGFFANRNHNALFIAMGWPLLALWAVRRGRDPQQELLRRIVGGVAALALVPLMIGTGSRAGLLLAVVGIGFGWWLIPRGSVLGGQVARTGLNVRRWALGAAAGGVVVLVGAAIFLSRAESLRRLMTSSYEEESRLEFWPTAWRILADFAPFGSGFGSFDPVFRRYEPDALLDPTYINHAHNDLLELVMTGGLPALAVLFALIYWLYGRSRDLPRRRTGSTRERYALLGFAMIVLALLASLVDYPLRTPLHAMLFAFACGWLAQGRAASDEKPDRSDQPLRASHSPIEAATSPEEADQRAGPHSA
jgi:O-antigen ligase